MKSYMKEEKSTRAERIKVFLSWLISVTSQFRYKDDHCHLSPRCRPFPALLRSDSHQPAAAQSGPRPTRRINAHILNWVRKRERGLSLWDLARPTRHIPSHNAALSTTAQQPWQGAEKKSRRRTD
ncbi:hypothetical protein IRJ41_004836 [Triplophysa rosa]|uniref:Uncharacterized protein n=1 Tax=Triplophysa rosa TaxID=992332 RepID=A0A9W7WNA7_TRIRA|nr:hypothetical protein IRJ41_004836 [Triplophysa rosa]